jgi:hypothetical protein
LERRRAAAMARRIAQAIGELESLDAKGRMRVLLLDLMSGKVQVRLHRSALEAA